MTKWQVLDLQEKYNFLEQTCILKSQFALWLFKKRPIRNLFYLDSDLFFMGNLNTAIKELRHKSVLLTPHFTQSKIEATRGEMQQEAQFAATGFFNLGFFGLNKTRETIRFLSWWHNRTLELCTRDLSHGLFDDQRWIDLAIHFFSGIQILRDPGYNVANWNLFERRISQNKNKYLVNGRPAVFFHFSGFPKSSRSKLLSHYRNTKIQDFAFLEEIVSQYRRDLADLREEISNPH